MATVTQLNFPNTDRDAELFDEFMKNYPHHPHRRNRAKAKAKFDEVIQRGAVTLSKNKDSGLFEEVPHDVTAEQLVAAAFEYFKALIPKGSQDYKPVRDYVPAAEVWLNSGQYTGYIGDWGE